MTDRRLIIQSGFRGIDFQTLYYKDIHNVTLSVGVVDKLLGVGDVYFDMGLPQNAKARPAFLYIVNPYEIYLKYKRL